MQRRIVEVCAKLCGSLTVACSQELDLCGGPTSSHLEALILLGRLASYRPASTISSIVIRAVPSARFLSSPVFTICSRRQETCYMFDINPDPRLRHVKASVVWHSDFD